MLKTMKLPVKLTHEEVRLKGEKIARLLKEKETLEEKRKDVAKRLKDEIVELDEDVTQLRDEVREHREIRDVQVEDVKDWSARIVRTTRMDTGETVASRPMSPAELQQHLSLVEEDEDEGDEGDEDEGDEDESVSKGDVDEGLRGVGRKLRGEGGAAAS